MMTETFDRRTLIALAGLAGVAIPAVAGAQPDGGAEHMQNMKTIPADAPKVAMMVFPKMVALDLIGPMTVFRILPSNVQLVWKNKYPVSTDVGLPIAATHTFEDCYRDLDVLLVPGGILGTVDCMNDPQVCGFLAERGGRAKWVASVCTGGLAVAAAGLFKGYDATAFWPVADLLSMMGAHHVNKRVVIDRNRISSGGVTAGIDLALTLAAQLKGEEEARRVQLTIEYSPEPPFSNGTPAEAGPQRTAVARGRRMWMDSQARQAAEAAGKRLGVDVPSASKS